MVFPGYTTDLCGEGRGIPAVSSPRNACATGYQTGGKDGRNCQTRYFSYISRHSFAGQLLQADYDIRTIQELLGYSDVGTTMIYTQTIKSRTKKEAKSPLDFS